MKRKKKVSKAMRVAIVLASSTFLLATNFPNAVKNCSNSSYRFATMEQTQAQAASAKLAKTKFCGTLGLPAA